MNNKTTWLRSIILLAGLWTGLAAAAGLDDDIEQLRADVAALSFDLFQLEEEFLHPSDTQLAVFLSVLATQELKLDSIELLVNNKPAATHIYTDRERRSLREGGVQRLYVGNLPTGEHSLDVKLTAQTAKDRYVRREAGFTVRKKPGESRFQLVLDARAPDHDPDISIQEW